MKRFYISLLFFCFLTPYLWRGNEAFAQQCDPSVPVFNVNLTGNAGGSWISPIVSRNGLCCGASGADVCVEFVITLDSLSSGIRFDIASGAIPSGALYYQINCGPPTPVGSYICLNGVGPHHLTFCKPGGNANTFEIQSIPQPSLTGTQWISQACSGQMIATGLVDTSVNWTSIPSNPQYNSYLSCLHGCDTVNINLSGANMPSYVDYQVCGNVIGGCNATYFCDTIRVNFVNDLAVSITPHNPTICYGSGFATVTAQPTGGNAPYTYSWSNGATTQSVNLTVGTYIVQLNDSMHCSTAYDTVIVTAFNSAINANAGIDQVLCLGANSAVTLNGTITAAAGGIWTGGGGSYNPTDTVMNSVYTPSASEITAGFAQLLLITTGNLGCPADTDSIRINIAPQPSPQISGGLTVCELTTATYTASNSTPVSYIWSVVGGTLLSSNNSNPVTVRWNSGSGGSISVTAANSLCDSTVTYPVTINPKPTPVINGSLTACVPTASTFSLSNPSNNIHQWSVTNGTIVGSATGSSVTVQWNNPGTGQVTETETNSFGCDSTVSVSVTLNPQPYPQVTGSFNVCELSTANYTASCNIAASYLWTVAGGTLLSPNNIGTVTVQWNNAGGGTITFKATHAAGCDSTIVIPVTINPKPTPVINGPLSACVPTTSVFSLSNPSGNTHNWNVTGGTIVGSSIGGSIVVQWNSPGTGQITETETNSFGCDSTVSVSVMLNPQPYPQVTGSLTVCEHTISTYNASCNVPASYLWTINGGTLLSPNNNSIVNIQWNNSGSGTITLKATHAAGCDSTIVIPVTINPKPTPSISGPATTCVPILATYSLMFPNTNTHNWSVSGGTIVGSSTGNNIAVQWNNTGSAQLSVTEINSFGCDSTVTMSVVLNPYPTPVMAGRQKVCMQDTATYWVPNVPGHTYNWSVTGGNIISFTVTNSIDVYWSASGQGEVRVDEMSAAGCDSLVKMPVRVNPLPAPTVTGPLRVCENQSFVYLTPNNGSNFSWNVTGGYITGTSALSDSINVLWGGSGNGSILIMEIDTNGCINNTNVPVQVQARPHPVISGSNTGCVSTALNHYSTISQTGINYSWSTNGGVIANGNGTSNVSVLWTAVGTYAITVTATNLSTGCDSFATILVTVDTLQTPVITASNYNGCAPLGVYFNSNTMNPNYSYNWSFGDGSSSWSINPSHQYNNSGNFPVTLVVSSNTGCSDSVASQVTVFPTPVAYFEDHLSGDAFYNTTPFTLQNLSTGGTHYLWLFGDGDTSSAFEPQYQYQAPGTYTITLIVTNNFGCFDTTQSIVEIKAPEELYIPNAFTPNGDDRNELFNVIAKNIQKFSITIFNRWGEAIFQSKDKDFVWDGTFKGSTVQGGVYVYQVKATGDYGKEFTKMGTVTVVR